MYSKMLLIETVHEVWVVGKKELVQRSSAAGKQRSTEVIRGHKTSNSFQERSNEVNY
jgi:hypothetical protein